MSDKLNFGTSDYIELIRVVKMLSSSPMMKCVTNEIIQIYLKTKEVPEYEFMKFLCHTQIVETCIKLVTELAGYVRVTLHSR